MSSEGWNTWKIGDIGRIVTGKTPPTQNPNNFGNKYPFITPRDMLGQKRIQKTERYLSEEGKSAVKNCLLPAKSVCISCIGSDMGKVVMTTTDSVTNQQLNSIICKDSFDPDFVYYALVNISDELRNVGHHSTAVPILNKTDFSNFEITAPGIVTQRRIADILSALDEKIELNRQTNATLEAFARVLFKSWFIDFDPVRTKADGYPPIGMDAKVVELFPNKFIDTELGEIPDSWEIKSIGEIAKRVAMGPFGSSIKVETFVDEGIPIISGQHLRGFMLEDSTYNFITLEHAEKLNKANVFPGDVIFTHAGNIGNLAFIHEDSEYPRYVVSQRQFFMRCDLSKTTPSFITYYFQSPEGQHKLLANTSSVGVPSIAQPVTYLKSIKLPIPPPEIMEAFEQIVKPLNRKYKANDRESRTLVALRDALLPKLMSGEIKV
jgi:type I restriction enzyme S subunit